MKVSNDRISMTWEEWQDKRFENLRGHIHQAAIDGRVSGIDYMESYVNVYFFDVDGMQQSPISHAIKLLTLPKQRTYIPEMVQFTTAGGTLQLPTHLDNTKRMSAVTFEQDGVTQSFKRNAQGKWEEVTSK